MSDIDKTYDDMLRAADSIAENGMTNENAEAVKNVFDNVAVLNEDGALDPTPESVVTTASTSDEPTVIDASELNSPEGEVALNNYNPMTGDIVTDSASGKEIVDGILEKQWDAFLGVTDKTVIDIDTLKSVMRTEEVSQIKDIAAVAELVKRVKRGEKFSIYSAMPTDLKALVDNAAAASGRFDMASKSFIAKAFIGQLAADYKRKAEPVMDLDLMLAKFDEDIKHDTEEMAKDLGAMFLSIDEQRNAELDAAIKRCEESEDDKSEALAKLRAIKDTINNAYDLTDFAEFCKTVRIKKFDIEKPSRTFDSFDAKYAKHTNNINDIKDCPTILDRHIDDHIGNLKLCLAFCKYAMNMSPDDIRDHAFMYYFIRNIIAIDRLNPKGNLYESMDEKSKKFYDGYVNNLKTCIANIK